MRRKLKDMQNRINLLDTESARCINARAHRVKIKESTWMTRSTGSSKATATSRTFIKQKWCKLLMCGFFSLAANYLRFCISCYSLLWTWVIYFEFKGENMEKSEENIPLHWNGFDLSHAISKQIEQESWIWSWITNSFILFFVEVKFILLWNVL